MPATYRTEDAVVLAEVQVTSCCLSNRLKFQSETSHIFRHPICAHSVVITIQLAYLLT